MAFRCSLLFSAALAQDLFLGKTGAPQNTSTQLSVGVHAPTKASSPVGCTSSCDSGDDFDHWNQHAYSGGITRICMNVGAPKWNHEYEWIIGVSVWYGDKRVRAGETSKYEGETDCIDFQQGEVITQFGGVSGCTPEGASHHAVGSITIATNLGRTKKWVGKKVCGSYSQIWTATTPGQHLTAFWGRASSSHIGWDGLVSKLGIYYDSAVYDAKWQLIATGQGSPPSVEYTKCTSATASAGFSTTQGWIHAAMTETSTGFNVAGGETTTKMVLGASAYSVTQSASVSFSTTECIKQNIICGAGTNYAYQFFFLTSVANVDAAVSTPHVICSADPRVCCLPTEFVDRSDASKGCIAGGTNLC